VEVADRPVELDGLTPGKAMRAGMALVPADRQSASGVPQLSLRENVTLPIIDQHFVFAALNKRREATQTRALLEHYGVRPAAPGRQLGTLSGGNQQKALLAKWFQRQPDVLLLHEPTQGVDVGAREDIFAEIRQIAETHGTGILFVSSDYDDFTRICDRVLVFRYGRVVGELAGASLTQERLIEACYSTVSAESAA
jgi:ribose transport system ATP-binding protein